MSEIEATPADPATAKAAKAKRHILLRLFGIKPTGWLRLILLCILVGFIVMAAEFDPARPEVNAVSAVQRFLSSAIDVLGWAIRNFWKPALAGASIVLPIWVLWRVATLPFRR